MAAFNFPSSPSNGDNYSANGVTFTYNSSSGAWIRASAVGAQGATGATGAQGATGSTGAQGAANATTINSNTNNYLITGTGTANTLQGESSLTFDGTQLVLASGKYVNTSSPYRVAGHPVLGYDSFSDISGGSYATRLGSTGTSTLRSTQIYGGGSHIATFDGVNTRLGINETAPEAGLHITGGLPSIRLENSGTSASANDVFGQIDFKHNDSTDAGVTAAIKCVAEDANGNSFLAFHNGDGGNADERLRIDSNGRIILGSTSNSAFATGQAYRLFQIGQVDGGWINLARTATPADGNHLGAIQGFARGADGTYHDTVAIDYKADGTPSNTSKPSKIEFYATPSGSTSKELKKTIRASGNQQNYVGTQPFDVYSTGSGEKYSIRLLNSDASAGNQIGIYFGPSNNVAGAYIAGYAYGDFASTANRDGGLRFGVRQNGTFKEVVRINDGGFFQATNIEGNYETHTFAADLAHQFNSNQRYKTTLWLRNTNTNFENGMFRCAADRGANTAYHFITCTSGDLTDDEFRVRGDGKVYGDNSYSIGADYAEYFEWSDGNTSNQDRRGMTVVLDGNKVKLSTSSDSADNIIGVVSGNPSVVGDSSWSAWSQKYLKDDYNQYILDSDGYRQLNSSYDDTKTYTPRAERQEWDAIGMVGKLRIVKGQKTGTRWIKMRDISDTVEEWLVR